MSLRKTYAFTLAFANDTFDIVIRKGRSAKDAVHHLKQEFPEAQAVIEHGRARNYRRSQKYLHT